MFHFFACSPTDRVLALEKVSLAISEEIQVQLLSEAELNNEPSTKKISLELHHDVAYLEKKKSGIYDLVEASFDSLQVRKFKRPKRARKAAAVGPDQLFVCEQKFRLVFTGSFRIPGSMDTISLRVSSMTYVPGVYGNMFCVSLICILVVLFTFTRHACTCKIGN